MRPGYLVILIKNGNFYIRILAWNIHVLEIEFFAQNCEIRVLEALFLMYYLYDMQVVFQKNQQNTYPDMPD